MTKICYTFLAFCILIGGCSLTTQNQKKTASAKEGSGIVQVNNFKVTDKTLTLDYIVSNPFDKNIHVCQDINAQNPKYDVETRIDEKYVRIKLSLYHEPKNKKLHRSTPTVYPIPSGFGKYLCLSPGESFSGKLVLDLPIKDSFIDSREYPQKYKKIVLHRVIFEIGYFGPGYSGFFKGVYKYHKIEATQMKTS